MKLRLGLSVISVLGIILAGCSLPTLRLNHASGSKGTTVSQSSGQFSLSVDSGTGQGILTTPAGKHLAIKATADNGKTVVCTDPSTVLSIDGGSAATPTNRAQLILGRAANGESAAWIYRSGKFVAPENAQTHVRTPYLGDSAADGGLFGRALGWSYTYVDHSRNHELLAGVAVNKRGVHFGDVKVNPGASVGVYWRVYTRPKRDRHDGHGDLRYFISPARVIGTLARTKWQHKMDHGGKHFQDNRSLADGRDGHGGSPRFRGHDRAHAAANLLATYLLQHYSDYLVSVAKVKTIPYNAKTHSYSVQGKNQDNKASTATISPDNTVQLKVSSQGTGGSGSGSNSGAVLVPSAITYSPSAALAGGSLSVTLTVTNQSSTPVAGGYTVDFRLATSTSFSLANDTLAGSTTSTPAVPAGPGSQASFTVTLTNFPAPSTMGSNEAAKAYLYAVVDPTSSTTATSSNVSAPSSAADLAVFAANTTSFSLNLETYAPSTGTATAGTTAESSANPGIVLYKQSSSNSGQIVPVSFTTNRSWTAGVPGFYNGFTANGLKPGTVYYIGIQEAQSGGTGPYALAALPSSSNISASTFTDLTQDPNTANDGPAIPTSGGTPTMSSLPVPSQPVQMKIGASYNEFLASSSDTDWYTFTLP